MNKNEKNRDNNFKCLYCGKYCKLVDSSFFRKAFFIFDSTLALNLIRLTTLSFHFPGERVLDSEKKKEIKRERERERERESEKEREREKMKEVFLLAYHALRY